MIYHAKIFLNLVNSLFNQLSIFLVQILEFLRVDLIMKKGHRKKINRVYTLSDVRSRDSKKE